MTVGKSLRVMRLDHTRVSVIQLVDMTCEAEPSNNPPAKWHGFWCQNPEACEKQCLTVLSVFVHHGRRTIHAFSQVPVNSNGSCVLYQSLIKVGRSLCCGIGLGVSFVKCEQPCFSLAFASVVQLAAPRAILLGNAS
jgi:hypothetical protein